ncbi:MAG: DUF4338 domain-containing protein [Lentisphaerae bacterium]|nr:DUF4338 domain-containing protein [Lentisphaerota bacterium]
MAVRRLKQPPTEIIVRGRAFSKSDILAIRQLTKANYKAGRTRISEEICGALDWRQPNGWLKDRACRDVLRFLEARGYLRLPPRKARGSQPRSEGPIVAAPPDTDILRSSITVLEAPTRLCLVKGGKKEREWNALVDRHHYLGHRVTVGKCLKFTVCSGDSVVAAMSLAESCWSVSCRDEALAGLSMCRDSVANNSRFLIPPWVTVKNAASRCLALLATDGVKHWERYYAIELKCLETFVDPSRFLGTCYRAANWCRVGKTKGYKKCGARHHNSQTPKDVYLYPLTHKQRLTLRQLVDQDPDGERHA